MDCANPGSLFAMAIEIADTGAFASANQIIGVMRSMAFEVGILEDPQAVRMLNQRCIHAVAHVKIGH